MCTLELQELSVFASASDAFLLTASSLLQKSSRSLKDAVVHLHAFHAGVLVY